MKERPRRGDLGYSKASLNVRSIPPKSYGVVFRLQGSRPSAAFATTPRLLAWTEPTTIRLDCPTICHQIPAFSSGPDRERNGV
jgi:hypothetical protein